LALGSAAFELTDYIAGFTAVTDSSAAARTAAIPLAADRGNITTTTETGSGSWLTAATVRALTVETAVRTAEGVAGTAGRFRRGRRRRTECRAAAGGVGVGEDWHGDRCFRDAACAQ
jgi:hypothetical protein